jgi:gamma-glutamyl phosphate reductase
MATDGGTFADDADVDWRDDELTFTLTAELVDAVDQCIWFITQYRH